VNTGPVEFGFPHWIWFVAVELMLNLEDSVPPEGGVTEVRLNTTLGQFEPGHAPPPETVPERVTGLEKPPKLSTITVLEEPRTPRLIGSGFARDSGPINALPGPGGKEAGGAADTLKSPGGLGTLIT